MKLGWLISIVVFCVHIGVVSSSQANMYPGCDCAAVTACKVAICAAEAGGLGCLDKEDRWDAVCVCKAGGMAYCTNWSTDLVNCSDVNLDVCNSGDLKAKLGKNYDKALQASKDVFKNMKE